MEDSLDTLSDGDAVAMLFDLVNRGDGAGDEMQRLDAMVFARLLRSYGDEAVA